MSLALAGFLLFTLATAVGSYRHGMAAMADRRAAIQTGERVLAELQAGRPAPASGASDHVDVESLNDPAPQGHRWVRVHVTRNTREAVLTGLVAREAGEGK